MRWIIQTVLMTYSKRQAILPAQVKQEWPFYVPNVLLHLATIMF